MRNTSLLALAVALFAFFFQAGASCAGNLNIFQPPGLADGSGIWVNMWNYPDGDLEAYCLKLHASGIRNYFVQTSRPGTPAICNPERLGEIIEACHRYKIRVIAWSFAELGNPLADAERLIAAARFTTPRGERLDSIAANLEKDLNHQKVEVYSARLREALGPNYPMVAVVYSPLNKAPQVANIPWKILAKYYDVLAPMDYWNGKRYKSDSYSYTIATIQEVRRLAGRSDVEIHVIGDGMGTQAEAIHDFLRACHDGEATSASLYPNQRCTESQMECLSHYSDYFPANNRFRLAAYRELLRNGSLEAPVNHDPSKTISRGDFYKAAVRQLKAGNADTPQDAIAVLLRSGLLPHEAAAQLADDSTLSEAIQPQEAIGLVAAIVDLKSANQRTLHHKVVRGRSTAFRGSWLIQPAYAGNAHAPGAPSAKPLSYLDAAQIVLQASAGLR